MDHIREVEQLRARILYLDEVLTMSARMAAQSGDQLWERRYRTHELELDQTIKQAMAVAPGSASDDAAAKIDAANIALVNIENQAFVLVRAGRKEAAQAQLESPAYAANKAVYTAGITDLTSSLDLELTQLRQAHEREVMVITAVAAVVLGLLLTGWMVSGRALRSWRRHTLAANEQLALQKRELSSLHTSERQASGIKLVATNLALQAEVESRTRTQGELDQLFTASLDLLALGSFDGRVRRVNPSFSTACGYRADEMVDQPFANIAPEEDRPQLREKLARVAAGETLTGIEMRLRTSDGRVRHAQWNLVPFVERGVFYATGRDITDRMQAATEQAKLEDRLRAAQKMEAVGSLAGGVAHDFNNLLSVILSYLGFVLDALPQQDPRRDDLMEVKRAAERAAGLTRQLLAFGRKQVLQPAPLNLNQVAASMEGMLRRILGEDISLVQSLEPHLGLTMADPGQIEQVTMNLVVNARDAMPAGGCLTIETSNVDFETDQIAGLKAGHYVVLTVTDTGCGMDAATKARVFEPFFTTKEVGKGTGLGLATVYGIVKQSGGHVSVYSEQGVGTTFRVYLPRDDAPAPLSGKKLTGTLPVPGTEIILVVEDEAAVRASVARILGANGYQVLTAGNGLDALELCKSHSGAIDLVLTDVVMPKMNGAVFAKELAVLRPLARILFMSGYSGDAIVHKGILDPGTEFIGKPFNATSLTRKVRQVLDAPREAYPTDPILLRKAVL